jgi:site-specific recombinase XerC
MLASPVSYGRGDPWNKGKLVGQKSPLRLRDIWAIRVRLGIGDRKRELALFNMALDSKLLGCDLVQLRVRDVAHGARIAARAIVMQQKTRPVQFEITEPTRKSVFAWIRHAALKTEDYLFPSRLRLSRQYARIVHAWVAEIGLDAGAYGAHTMRRTKAALIYRRTKNLRAVQLLLGHTKLEKYSQLPGDRGRRYLRDGRADRGLRPHRRWRPGRNGSVGVAAS